MADVGTGYVDILPRTDTFLGALKGQMGDIFSQAQGSLGSITKSFTAVQTAAVGAGILAATGIAKGIDATQEWAGEVRSLQRATGLAAEDASKLAAAGTELGIPVEKLNTTFAALSKNIVNGSANFDKYNIATKDASGNTLPFLDILGNISDKFATLAPGVEQTAFATNIFGRSGRDLIPVLSQGSAGLQEFYDKAQAAGLVMGQDTLDASKNLTLAQRDLGEAVKGAAIQLGESFLPVLTVITKALTSFVELVQLIPAPILSMGAAFVTLAAGTIVAVKAFGVLKVALAGSGAALLDFALIAAPLVLVMEAIAVHAQSMADNFAVMGSTVTASVDELSKASQGGLLAMTEFAVLFQHAVDLGKQAGISFNEVAGQVREKLAASFSAGKLTAGEFTRALEVTGLTADQAGALLTSTAQSSDTLKVHFDKAGQAVRNFADLTGKALQEWASSVTSSLTDTFSSLQTTIKNTFTLTPKQLQKAFDQMLAATIRFKRDEAALLALKPGTFGLSRVDTQKFEKYLLDQGPAAVDAFVRSTTQQQQKIVSAWSANVASLNRITKGVNDVTIKADTSAAKASVSDFVSSIPKDVFITVHEQNVKAATGATGGVVSTRGIGFAAGGSTDTIPAMLSPGEFVMRKSAVDRIGVPAMRAMNAGGAVGISKPQKLDGVLRISDWRTGLTSLDAELSWEDTVRTR